MSNCCDLVLSLCSLDLLLLRSKTLFFFIDIDPKIREVDSGNRKFLIDWTEQYCFKLPEIPGATIKSDNKIQLISSSIKKSSE